MARIRAALWRAESRHGQPSENGGPLHPFDAAEALEAEIPFIEVGGRHMPI
jgi:hypothetical protein